MPGICMASRTIIYVSTHMLTKTCGTRLRRYTYQAWTKKGLLARFNWLVIWLGIVFFAAFTLLEAQLPSWVSKVAPSESKGLALGIYTTSQFSGIFLGGVVGGLLQNTLGTLGVIFWSILLLLLWLICVLDLKSPTLVASSKT